MERNGVGNILHKTDIRLCTAKGEDVIFSLKIIWSSDTTHVLLAVNNYIGRLRDIMLLTRSKGKKLTWPGFSNTRTYSVQVYGLKLDTTTGLERREQEDTTLYSVVGVKKFIMHRKSLGDTEVADFTEANGWDSMVSSLGEKTEFDIEPKHEPPMDHHLKPTLPPGSTAGLYIVFNEETKKEYLMMSSLFCHSSSYSCEGIPLPIQQSRTVYKVRAIALKNSVNHTFGSCHIPCGKSRLHIIKTYNSMEDLQMLMEKAQAYCQSRFRSPRTYPIQHLYRNKPRHYFDDILNNKDGLMVKYIKDDNGDPYCPINNEIDGLFFSASLDTADMRPPSFSYFGDTRLFVPAEELITSDTRMYFSDFYCHNEVHYVTVVLTRRGSLEDEFCELHLLKLDLENNPFFTIQEVPSIHPCLSVIQKSFNMVSVDMFHVEFFYTQDVDIAALIKKCGYGRSKNNVRLTKTAIRGRGQSTDNGIPKKTTCRVCNLD